VIPQDILPGKGIAIKADASLGMLDEISLLVGIVQAGDIVGAAELGGSVKDRAAQLGACGVIKVTNSLVMAWVGEGDFVKNYLGGLVEVVLLRRIFDCR
jgi:hypothetical protein